MLMMKPSKPVLVVVAILMIVGFLLFMLRPRRTADSGGAGADAARVIAGT